MRLILSAGLAILAQLLPPDAVGSGLAQTVDRIDAVPSALGACVDRRLVTRRVTGQREMAFSVTFRRDGSIIGVPRRTHSFPDADQPDQAELLAAVANAIMACAPLPFSKGLGEAIAGRPFRFRYIFKPSQDRPA